LIKRLFELEVPEIADGIVELKACAREPGHRTKISVWSNDPNVDPVGACVGARGSRVRMVVNDLNGEKVDIIPFSEDPYEFVAKALSPAKVREVRIDFATGTAEVIVPDFQLSLAIGKEGQNARLAHRLTGWRIDIKSESQIEEAARAAEREAEEYQEDLAAGDWAEGEWVTDEETGEQMWQPADGSPAISVSEWTLANEMDDDQPDSGADVDAGELVGAGEPVDADDSVDAGEPDDAAEPDEAGEPDELDDAEASVVVDDTADDDLQLDSSESQVAESD